MRWLNPEIALGFLVATIFWAAVLGWQASYAPTEKEKQKCYETAKSSGRKTEECKTFWERTTSDPIALYNFGVFVFTGVLGISTIFLWRETRNAAKAALRQTNVMMAVEFPMPLIAAFKLAQYTQIPGETIVADPLPPGPIPPNCRILFAVENKGRTPASMIELCIEKFAGITLPNQPTYTHVTPWPLVLEKGPIWIRGDDQYIVVTAADIRAATAAYQGAGAFWVYGYFAYRNLLKERVEHKFLARWDQTYGFIGENRPRYT